MKCKQSAIRFLMTMVSDTSNQYQSIYSLTCYTLYMISLVIFAEYYVITLHNFPLTVAYFTKSRNSAAAYLAGAAIGIIISIVLKRTPTLVKLLNSNTLFLCVTIYHTQMSMKLTTEGRVLFKFAMMNMMSLLIYYEYMKCTV